MVSFDLCRYVSRSALLSCLLTAASMSAQCQFNWQPGSDAPSPAGYLKKVLSTANGDIYAGGFLVAAGATPLQNIGRYDGSQWDPLGSGIDGGVYGLIELQGGGVVACGAFGQAGAVVANNIARWDGSAWSPLGAGCSDRVLDMALLPNGDLVAVGDFAFAGGVNAQGVAVWDGVSWSALGPGPGLLAVKGVTVRSNGDVVVCGHASAGAHQVRIWDGTSWSGLNGVSPGQLSGVENVHELPSGEIVIDGFLIGPGIYSKLSIWDGATVQPLAPPFFHIHDLATAPNGDLLVAGEDLHASVPPVARYDGSTWTMVGNSFEPGLTLLEVGPSGSVIMARPDEDELISSMAELQSSQWMPIAASPAVLGNALAATPGGDVYGGGWFTSIEGVAANNVAKRGPQGWVAMGQGVDRAVSCLAVAPDGSVIAGGGFQNAGGIPANHVARWDGNSWSALGAGLPLAPRLLAVNNAGHVVATVFNNVYIFDGQAWSNVGTLLGSPRDVLALDNGDFLICGDFFDFGSAAPQQGMARVSSGQLTYEAAWSGYNCSSMVADGSGGVFVGHTTSTIDRYDPVALSSVTVTNAPSFVRRLQLAPNGDLFVLGSYFGVRWMLHRWDGSVWKEIVRSSGPPETAAYGLALGARGEIHVCGRFFIAAGLVSMGFARADTACPAGVSTIGVGCVGGAGIVELEARSMPWIGATLDQVATGMTPTSLALHLVGTQSGGVPLPLGASGCSLIVAPVFSEALMPQGGEVAAPLTIPAQAALIGQDLFTQVVGLELGSGLTLMQTTGSNALQLTIGAF